MSALFAFLHHIAAFTLVGALAVEFVCLKDTLTAANARRLLRADAVLGAAAVTVLAIGLLRAFYFEKGMDYYLHSVPFLVKLVLFGALALASIYPTVQYMSWRAALRRGAAPVADAATLRRIRTVVHAELASVAAIILMAALMARGVAMFE